MNILDRRTKEIRDKQLSKRNVRRWLKEGKTGKEIAKIVKCSPDLIYRRIKMWKLK